MHLIILKPNTTACKLKNLSRYSSSKLIQYIKFLLKQSEVNKSHSQENKSSLVWDQKVSEVLWEMIPCFLMKHVLKPTLSDRDFFSPCFPSFLVPSGMLHFLTCRKLPGFPGLQAGREPFPALDTMEVRVGGGSLCACWRTPRSVGMKELTAPFPFTQSSAPLSAENFNSIKS